MSCRAQQDLSKRCAVSAWFIGMRLNQRNRAAGIRVFEVPDQDTLCAAGLCHGVDLWKDRYDCTRGGHKPNGSQTCAFLFIQYPPPCATGQHRHHMKHICIWSEGQKRLFVQILKFQTFSVAVLQII